MPKVVAVTGCAGFIGRSVTRQLLARGDYVYGVDRLTYAADPDFLTAMTAQYGLRFQGIVSDVRALGRWPDVDAVLHLAAETHVDNSLTEAAAFLATNVDGTRAVLDLTLAKRQHGMPKLLYVSTDEVYGPRLTDAATVDDPLKPSSPYAASKAAGDLLVQAYGTTYGLPYTILRPTNTYGPGQYPEKLIPKTIRNLRLGRPVPVHGDGLAERCWLHVEDCASAILFALDRATPPIVNIGGNTSATVREVVAFLVAQFRGEEDDLTDCVEFGYERPGADARYAVDDSALRGLGWSPVGNLWSDLPGIVERERFRW